jgi:hypothetical protein
MKPKFKVGQKVKIIKGFPILNHEDNRDVGRIGKISKVSNFLNLSYYYYDVHVEDGLMDFIYPENYLEPIRKQKGDKNETKI